MNFTRRTVVGSLAATILRTETRAATPARPPDGLVVLEAAPGSLSILPTPGPATGVWAYNGQVPGPLLRVPKGREVAVRLVNKLTQPTSLCWHGVRIVNAMDGVAGLTQAPVPPGGTFDYRFVPPDAGLYWYHPHVLPHSAEQIGRGLYGLLLVEGEDEPKVETDMLVVIGDWTLDAAGRLPSPASPDVSTTPRAEGGARTIVTIDSKPIPGRTIRMRPGARLRLRLLNACTARIALVALVGAEGLVVAIDGQASELFPPAAGMLPMGPGARFELIVDLPPQAGKTAALVLRDDLARPLMTFVTEGPPIPARPRVGRLPRNTALPTRIPLESSIKRDLVLTGGATEGNAGMGHAAWSIDGRGSSGFSEKPLFRVRRGGAVTLAFVNRTAVAQQMHVHGHVFRVLHDLDDGWDPYWRESILIAPGKTKHVAFVADNPGKWAVESLMLDRQVAGMAAWFEVV
jgi:FtsP/CotA-like multicopper oxidase with cupredoxin domain